MTFRLKNRHLEHFNGPNSVNNFQSESNLINNMNVYTKIMGVQRL